MEKTGSSTNKLPVEYLVLTYEKLYGKQKESLKKKNIFEKRKENANNMGKLRSFKSHAKVIQEQYKEQRNAKETLQAIEFVMKQTIIEKLNE